MSKFAPSATMSAAPDEERRDGSYSAHDDPAALSRRRPGVQDARGRQADEGRAKSDEPERWGVDAVRLPETREWRDATNTARKTQTQEMTMKWITREHPRVDRVACPWLVQRFVDKAADFVYVPSDQVAAEARKTGATPYDIKDVELGHHGPECSFDAFVHKYELDKDPAVAYMAKVIRGADTADKTVTPESVGVEALLDGMRLLHYPDDQAQRKASIPVLDALYAYCKEKVAKK